MNARNLAFTVTFEVFYARRVRPNTAFQSDPRRSGARQDRAHFGKQIRSTNVVSRRGRLNARPLGRN